MMIKSLNKYVNTYLLAYSLTLLVLLNHKTSEASIVTNQYGVMLLNKSNLYEAIQECQPIIIMFYASWCMHSQALLPKFSEWSKEFDDKQLPLRFAQIDADAEPEVKAPFNIDSYPTLVLFKDGNPLNFEEYPYASEKQYLMPWLQQRGINTI